jgi:methylamine dehydrogenase heavy chain
LIRASLAGVLLMLAAASVAPAAALPNDPLGAVRRLGAPQPHWMWVNDLVFPHMPDGQAYLIDGDGGALLGQLSTGFGFMRLVIPKDHKVIYSPETHFARTTRGARSDIVAIYDPGTLSPVGEIPIPAKRAFNVPVMGNAELTDDDRFLLVYNFNPAQSVTVVDTRSRQFVGEIETAGCALVYPTGPRSFFSICADGSLLDVRLDEGGALARQERTPVMFDVQKDPATEKGVRVGDKWLFVSYDGMVYPINIGPSKTPAAGATWSLLSDVDRKQSWRPGGVQQLAIHAGSRRLYAIMHQGPRSSHKDPGKDVWVYDLDKRMRVQQIALKNLAGSIQVTADTSPLLFSVFMDSTTTDIYDARSGGYLRSINSIGTTPTLLVMP